MRLRAILWLLLAALLMAATVARFYPTPPLETDLLALLPATERNPLAEQAASRLGRFSGERAVFLVGVADPESARQAAAQLAEELCSGSAFKHCIARIPNPDPSALLALYQPYRTGLLPADLRAAPLAADGFEARLAARLSGPFGGGLLPLAQDPFGLFDAWLTGLPFKQLRLDLVDGWLQTREQGVTWMLVSAELAGSAFDPNLQSAMQTRLQATELSLRQRWPALQLLRVGAVFHASAARQSAEREMNLIGSGSLLGIVLLLVWAYRSPGPLALGLLSVGVGLCTALLVSLAVFGRLHLMTLVFGASLIGEAIDYAVQYFSARLGAGLEWHARRGLRTVLPGLGVALATSVVGYTALAFTPFPALRQIAVFAISGLIAAWLTVVLALPGWLGRPAKPASSRLLAVPAGWLGVWRRISRRTFMILAVGLLALAASGWQRLTVDDDVRQLIQTPADLAAQEKQLRALTGMEAGSQFFLIEGADSEQVLQREETLSQRLAATGLRLQSVASFVPSCRTQQQDQARLLASWPDQRAVLQSAGFRDEALAEWQAVINAPASCLTPEHWLAAPLSSPFRHLWLQRPDHAPAGLALPSGYQQVSELEQASADLPGVTLVDKPGAVSRLFADYRRLAAWVLAGASLLILAVLAWRYGLRGGLAILLPTWLAQGLALGSLGWLGISLNLFNVLALLLVLGVGINYAIFLIEGSQGGERRQAAAQLGVLLSALTTLLSFGLLGLSAMPALSGFGITLALGISLAVLLAPSALLLGARPR
jgi:predicted exporter